ncbi:MAG: carboxypeptidase-like regulatory domain-containing protein [Bacteroidia bacterium]|nr:carboxypeptidase-like regulatory domain-containing protein [Bacteroidia bacterium]
MQQCDSSHSNSWIWLLLIVFSLGGIHPTYANPIKIRFKKKMPQESVIRISGQIIEQSSQRPVKNATVMVRGGELALASKRTDGEGRFEIYIPAKKITSAVIALRINYQNHIFTKDDITPISQDILIYINGRVLLEENPMAEYSLPIHKLDDPKIGELMIRF